MVFIKQFLICFMHFTYFIEWAHCAVQGRIRVAGNLCSKIWPPPKDLEAWAFNGYELNWTEVNRMLPQIKTLWLLFTCVVVRIESSECDGASICYLNWLENLWRRKFLAVQSIHDLLLGLLKAFWAKTFNLKSCLNHLWIFDLTIWSFFTHCSFLGSIW